VKLEEERSKLDRELEEEVAGEAVSE